MWLNGAAALVLLAQACEEDSTPAAVLPGAVGLNEISCAGDDWVELRNNSPSAVDLSGWFVTDSLGRPPDEMGRLPAGTTLSPGHLLVLYRDRDFPFGLSCGKDTLFLLDPQRRVHAAEAIPDLLESQSWGRLPEDSAECGVLRPTAGAENEVTPRFPAWGAGEPTGAAVGLHSSQACLEAGERLGQLACVDTQVESADLQALTIPETRLADVLRIGKFTLPATAAPGLLPALLQNVSLYVMHDEFLAAAFPQLFGQMDADEYGKLVMRRDTRAYFTGSLFLLATPGAVGFSVAWEPSAPAEVPRPEEVLWVAESLRSLLGLEDLRYVPLTSFEQDAAEAWGAPVVPILPLAEKAADGSSIEVYTPGTCYGYVRVLPLGELEAALDAGDIGWRDIVVLDEAPVDIPEVVAGIVTGTRQTELSHLTIRAERRGTPNLFVEGSEGQFKAHEGALVRLQVFSSGYIVETDVTPAEAEAFWETQRPKLSLEGTAELAYAGLPALAEVDVATADSRAEARRRFGSKGTNLAAAAAVADVPVPAGFLIPFHWYGRFMDENRIATGGEELTYREFTARLAADPEFAGSAKTRRQILEAFRNTAQEKSVLPEGLEAEIRGRIRAVFGDDKAMVRFRSSSNAEDLAEFPGAGLYESHSACAADSFDADDELPSRCDPNVAAERTLRDALIAVWMSAWNFQAYEERDYFRMEHEEVAMGILVTPRFTHEESNGLMTIESTDGALHVLLNAQWGGVSVVFPPPGVLPERTRLTAGPAGIVEQALVGRSNLLAEDEVVLPPERVQQLAGAARELATSFPVLLEPEPSQPLRLEVEWKFDKEGHLRVKQVRPLRREQPVEPEGVLLFADSAVTLCSACLDDRSVWREREVRSTVTFSPMQMLLPFDPAVFPLKAEWVEELRIGPAGEQAEPAGPGEFRLDTQSQWNDLYHFSYVQPFSSGGKPISFEWHYVVSAGKGEMPEGRLLAADDELAGVRTCLGPCGDPNFRIEYRSCTMEHIDAWDHVARLAATEGIARVTLRLKHAPDPVETGPLRLLYAEITRPDGSAFRVDDFFRLANSTLRHARSEDFLLDLQGELGSGAYLLVDEPDIWEPQVVRITVYSEDFDILAEGETADYSSSLVTGEK
jgi:hypothetical protein